MVKYLFTVLCNFIVALLLAQDASLPFDSVSFSFGKISYNNKAYTGSLIATYPDGSNKASANVVDGLYEGSVRTFYPGGQTHINIRFVNGQPEGILRAYYPNGEQKLQAKVQGQAREGGCNVKNISYWVYYQNKYKQKFKGSARLKFLTVEGLSSYAIGYMPANKIEAFALYDNKLRNSGKFIENSAEMYFPFERP